MTESTATLTLTDFLLARIAEDEADARVLAATTAPPVTSNPVDSPGRILAECEAKRRIIEFHKAWPVLVQRQPTFDLADTLDPLQITYRASQQIAWMTQEEYRNRFGDEPPTAPMLRALAAVYAGHPGYREEWRP